MIALTQEARKRNDEIFDQILGGVPRGFGLFHTLFRLFLFLSLHRSELFGMLQLQCEYISLGGTILALLELKGLGA